MKLILRLLLISTLSLATQARAADGYAHLDGEEACKIFRDYRAKTVLLQRARETGILDLDATAKSTLGSWLVALGASTLPVPVTFLAQSFAKRFSLAFLAANAGMIATGAYLLVTDANEGQVESVRRLFEKPYLLLSKSDDVACSYLYEFPALRAPLAEARDAAAWVLANRVAGGTGVAEGGDAKRIPARGPDDRAALEMKNAAAAARTSAH